VYKLESVAWLPGTRVGSYEIVDVLGDGGMGKVFRVWHLISNRDPCISFRPTSNRSH
jgi:serine/threonine protein kinase